MLTLIPEIVEQYAAHHTDVPAPLMDRLREETYASVEHPHMQTGRLEGTLLKLLVKISQARRVLEIGMFTGYSTLCMAEGLPEGGARLVERQVCVSAGGVEIVSFLAPRITGFAPRRAPRLIHRCFLRSPSRPGLP